MINLNEIPKNPGCYLFKDSSSKIIYVGKAKNLAKRVKSYFQKKDHDSHRPVYPSDRNFGAKTQNLVRDIDSVEFFITDNEVEALLLENTLIKKHRPKYNIDLRDSKRYAYIEKTDEEIPRLLITRKREKNFGGKYFGPFVSGLSRDLVLETVRRAFKIRTCNKFPKRECIRYSIGLCSAPCTGKISKTDYLRDVKSAEMVLKGRTKKLIEMMFRDMKAASGDMNYEKALDIKNSIEAIKYLEERQNMERQKSYNEDIINYRVHEGMVHLTLFNSKKGILESKHEFEFDFKENFLEEFIVQYYFDSEVPKEIVLPENIDESLIKFLNKLRKGKVNLVIPKKGEKKMLLDLVLKNIDISLFGNSEKVEDLRDKLKLNFEPNVIECFDISHLSGKDTVASMVQFRNGVADKKNYRKYKIRRVSKIDDYASMQEVVERRYWGLKKRGEPFPDLVIIDGGKGQLSAVMESFEKLKLKLPVISIAKREEEIFMPGRKTAIKLDKRSKALKFVQEIRDEAHRFAISYNRLLRKRKVRG